MNERRRVSILESSGEALRFVSGWLLAILLAVPALIIKLADKLTMWRIRHRAKRERQS
jgi:hypothetical protein